MLEAYAGGTDGGDGEGEDGEGDVEERHGAEHGLVARSKEVEENVSAGLGVGYRGVGYSFTIISHFLFWCSFGFRYGG